jgi:hypothetical protein
VRVVAQVVPVVVSVTVIVPLPWFCQFTRTWLPVAEPTTVPPVTVQLNVLAALAGVEYVICWPWQAWLRLPPGVTREIAVAVGVWFTTTVAVRVREQLPDEFVCVTDSVHEPAVVH